MSSVFGVHRLYRKIGIVGKYCLLFDTTGVMKGSYRASTEDERVSFLFKCVETPVLTYMNIGFPSFISDGANKPPITKISDLIPSTAGDKSPASCNLDG
ncbi:hypothetical protein NPIL_426061 [Nephila pilipes]|uniref:Uncharacterized protein n=1 Tax=Nephila pilipes TaxID=299642 RepID=A0A8X6Q2D6_NEPPI|nr:hypothetical protein NPIL_426061 [Nephila pilipes]